MIANFSWALTILLLAFYTDKPLGFSTFPALLLISTLFRLALNVSATRLILSDGNAGRVIGAIGQYVIHGNYVMGLVVFLILIIVQYVVVTNGAQRVAEVAARFTLDSMPGKQMSIDADLNMGLIAPADAKIRRAQIEKEANFYGAMDGASKFVKGDAIAGVLIVLVNLIGGFAIGMAQKGLSLSDAIQTYSLLTVGDGLITQIPALTISMATGIIVTRAATDAQLGSEVAKQIAAYPKSLLIVCCSLLGMLFLKGIPVLPVLLMLALFSACAWHSLNAKKHKEMKPAVDESIYDKMRIYPIEIQLNPDLFGELSKYEDAIFLQTNKLRDRVAHDMGFVLPEVKLRADKKLSYPHYGLAIQGNNYGTNQLYMDKVLAIAPKQQKLPFDGIAVREPVYGLSAAWIKPGLPSSELAISDPITVLMTHLNHIVHQRLAELLTRTETETLLNQDHVCTLRDELVPGLLSLGQVQRVLQHLLQEHVSIRLLPSILEVLLEHAKTITDTFQLTELVRARLATPICQKLMDGQTNLSVLTIAPALEQQLSMGLTNQQLSLDPSMMEQFILALASQVESMMSAHKSPVLLCSSLLRRQLKQLTQRVIPHLTVLGMNEIPMHIQVDSFSVVS